MTLTPDAPRPDDNDKFKKEDLPSSDAPVANGYGYDNVSPATPPAPSYAPPAPQYPDYAAHNNAPVNAGQGMYHNPAGQVPQNDMWSDAKKPENMSTILGGSSIAVLFLSFILGPFVLASPVLAIFGILQANKANRLGINATLGKVLSWVGLGLNALGVLLVILFFGLFLALFAGGAAIN